MAVRRRQRRKLVELCRYNQDFPANMSVININTNPVPPSRKSVTDSFPIMSFYSKGASWVGRFFTLRCWDCHRLLLHQLPWTLHVINIGPEFGLNSSLSFVQTRNKNSKDVIYRLLLCFNNSSSHGNLVEAINFGPQFGLNSSLNSSKYL